jgi:hypothetical protein
VPQTIDDPPAGDHRDKGRLGRLVRIVPLGILPNIDKYLLHRILGVVGISQHPARKRPYEPAVSFQTVLNGSWIAGSNSI